MHVHKKDTWLGRGRGAKAPRIQDRQTGSDYQAKGAQKGTDKPATKSPKKKMLDQKYLQNCTNRRYNLRYNLTDWIYI